MTSPYPGPDPATEISELRKQLRAFTQKVAENEAILARLRAHELTLLNADTLPDLLEAFVHGTARTFSLSAVTLALEDPDRELRRLLADSRAGDNISVMFAPRLSELSPVFKTPSRAYIGPYRSEIHRRLFAHRLPPRSVALLPLQRQERLLGALNLGSEDAQRFTHEHGTELLDHLGQIGAICLENALNRERLVQSTYIDVLTGSYNRRHLQKRLLEELARAQRYRHALCCLFFDLDHFKSINDTYGHATGDQVLAEFSLRLRRQLRFNDIVARYGGEEFAALLPETMIKDALALAERIRQKVREPMPLGEQTLIVTVSIGVCEYLPRQSNDDLETLGARLLEAADAALYQAKAQGRNRVVGAPAPVVR